MVFNDLIGNYIFGGDWILEIVCGDIEVMFLFSDKVFKDF